MTAKRGMSRSIMMVPGVSKKLFAKCFYLNVKPRRFPAYKLYAGETFSGQSGLSQIFWESFRKRLENKAYYFKGVDSDR